MVGRLFPAVAALVLLLSGCSGTSPLSPAGTTPKASFTDTNGGIEGMVLDPEHRPIAGAQLQIIGVPGFVNATPEGRFAFSDLVPQDYLVIVKASGFVDTQQPITVPSGNVTDVRIVMQPVPPPTPYADPVYRYAGKFTNGGGARVANTNYNSSGTAGQSGNSGKYDFFPRADWQTILLEVVWTPTRAEAERMSLKIWLPDLLASGSVGAGNSTFVAAGKSTLQWRIDRPQFDELRVKHPRLSFSTFVGLPYQVYPAMDPSGEFDYSLYLEQSFIVYGTVGYNGPLPADYTRGPPPA